MADGGVHIVPAMEMLALGTCAGRGARATLAEHQVLTV